MIDAEEPFDAAQTTPTGEIRHGMRQLTHDVVTLAELQANLLQVELREWLRRSATPAAMLALAATVVALASLPVLLLGLAHYVATAAEWTLAAALIAVGVGGIAVAALCGVAAWQLVRRANGAFTRFRTELMHNVRWLKQALSQGPADADTTDRYEPGRVRPR